MTAVRARSSMLRAVLAGLMLVAMLIAVTRFRRTLD